MNDIFDTVIVFFVFRFFFSTFWKYGGMEMNGTISGETDKNFG